MNLDSLKRTMKGVFVVETTPFNKDDSVDLDGMRENTRWLVKFGKGKDFAIYDKFAEIRREAPSSAKKSAKRAEPVMTAK